MKKRLGKACAAIISLGGIGALLLWSLWNYRPVSEAYGPRAIYSMTVLSVVLALACRWLLVRMLRQNSRNEALGSNPLFFIDVCVPLYLAAGALLTPPAAVLVALVTQGCLHAAFSRRFLPLRYTFYRVAAIGLIILVATNVYGLLDGPPHIEVTTQNFTSDQELINFASSFAADMIVLVLFPLSWLPIVRYHSTAFSWRQFLSMRAIRFQWMLLSVGLLVSIADFFDISIGELAWLIFLVPLLAIYWLILLSIRLSEQTNVLRHSLQRQEELCRYASNITRVQEDERKRLARELHDDTAQALIALARGLEGVKKQVAQEDLQWLTDLQDLADQTLEGVRRACRDLHPAILDDLGLRAALEWLSNSFTSRGLACTCACSGQESRLHPEAEVAIFRIVQEALSNSWRHASAKQVSIELHYLPTLVQVSVRDDGKGFVPNGQTGMGLANMRERALLIGADLTIISSPHNGCTVALSWSRPA
jgi:signal transduction histidine kinase